MRPGCGEAGWLAWASATDMIWCPAEQATKAFEESGRMTTSEAPGQPRRRLARLRLAGSMRLRELPLRLATARVLPSGERCDRDRLLAGADLGYFAAVLEIDDGDGVGAGVGDVCQLAIGVEIDGDGLAVERDGCGDGVVFSVDDREGTLAAGRAGVDDVDFVERGAGGQATGFWPTGSSRSRRTLTTSSTVTVPLPPLVT